MLPLSNTQLVNGSRAINPRGCVSSSEKNGRTRAVFVDSDHTPQLSWLLLGEFIHLRMFI